MAETLLGERAEAWTSAVARINVGEHRGTGFLVTEEGLVLTAFHVVGNIEQSLQKGLPIFHRSPISIVFGDGKKGTRNGGVARVVANRYSYQDDWALLQLENPALIRDPLLGDLKPLKPAKMSPPPSEQPFATFGFPEGEDEKGGEYRGTLGLWEEPVRGILEASIREVKAGMDMSGISGAPCMVQGHVVAIVLQQLANGKGAIKGSLYVIPIERAMRGCEGIAWDDGAPMLFQDDVTRYLPTEVELLRSIAEWLPRPWVDDRRLVARRLLSSDIRGAARALRAGALAPDRAKEILNCLGAMQLHADSVEGLKRSLTTRARPVVLPCRRWEVHGWFLRRARAPEPVARKRIVAIRTRPGDEESPRGSDIAAIVADILDRLKERLERHKLHRVVREGMLGGEVSADHEFWMILLDETRLDVLAAVRRRLPNAHVIAGSNAELVVPELHRELVDIITPTMREDEEKALIVAWASAAADLDVDLEDEVEI